MGKSIRSKIKRKHRAEFRKTIGTEAFVKTQKIVQERLEGNIEKQTLKSLDKLSSALATDATETTSAVAEQMLVDDNSITTLAAAKELRGENKVIVNKRSRKKQKYSYHMKGMVGKKSGEKEGSTTAMVVDKPRPRFFCKF